MSAADSRGRWPLWLRVGISVGILAVLLIVLPLDQVRDALVRLDPIVWLGVLAGFLVGHGLGALKWRLMVNAGRAGLGLVDSFRCYGAGLFANLCLPSIIGGDVLRAGLAGRSTGRMTAVVLGSLADRLIDVTALGLLLAGGILMGAGSLPAGLGRYAPPAVAAGALLGLAILLLLARRPLASWPPRVRRPLGRGLVAARRLLRRPGGAAAAFALALSMQAGFILLNAWIGRSIGIAVGLEVWFFAWPLAKVAGLLPISLGGLGVRDATLAGLLAGAGVATARGLVASLIWQTVMIAGGLAGGVLCWLLSRRRRPASTYGPAESAR